MNRSLGRLTLLSMLCIASLPVQAERVWSIEVVTEGKSPEALLREVRASPAARIDTREPKPAVLVGAWQDQAAARAALAEIKKRYPLSFIRSADLQADARAGQAQPLSGGIIAYRESSKGLAEGRAQEPASKRVPRAADVWSSRLAREPNAPAALASVAPGASSAASQAVRPSANQPGSKLPAQPGARATRERPSARAGTPSLAAQPADAVLNTIERRLAAGDTSGALSELRQRAARGLSVPPALLEKAFLAQARQLLVAAVRTGDGAEAGRIVGNHPDAVHCADPETGWQAAELLAAVQTTAQTKEAAIRVADRLLGCDQADIRIATLEKSFTWMPGDAWRDRLAKAVAGGGEGAWPEAAASRLAALVYREQVTRLAQWVAERDAATAPRIRALVGQMAPAVLARQDAPVATLSGWALLNARGEGGAAAAAAWFEQALRWAPGSADAQEGLVRVALEDRQPELAWQRALQFAGSADKRNALAGEAALGLAAAAQARGDAEAARAWFEKSAGFQPLPRYAGLQWAWAELKVGRTEQAVERFIDHYRQLQDDAAAQGVVQGLKALGQLARADTLPASAVLTRLLAGEARDAALGRKLFLTAARAVETAEGEGAVLAARVAPQAGVAKASRQKSGSEGGSRLTVRDAQSVLASAPVLRLSGWMEARADQYALEAGAPADGLADSGRPATRLWQAALLLRTETPSRWTEVEAGNSAARGPLGSRPLLRVATGWLHDTGALTLSLARQPVRESLLSWAGVAAPGQAWGAVMRDRLQVEGRQELGGGWTASAQAGIEHLSGPGVAGNRQQGAMLQVGHDLRLPGFDYAVLALGASASRAERNLSFFTPGHGGYFSPQRYWRVGPSLDFMTAEGRPLMLKGRLAWGRTFKSEAETPVLPLADDGRFYPGVQVHAPAWEVELGLAWQVLPHWQAGLWVNRRRASEYDDRAYLLSLRWQASPRSVVYSADLPHRLGAGWL